MAAETSNLNEKISSNIKPEVSQAGAMDWPQIAIAMHEIQEMFGFLPSFIDSLPKHAIPGAWAETKNLYFNPNTALQPKLKHLIGMAVASQIPCEMINYFEKSMSRTA